MVCCSLFTVISRVADERGIARPGVSSFKPAWPPVISRETETWIRDMLERRPCYNNLAIKRQLLSKVLDRVV